MKKILLFLVFISVKSFSADWDLFRFGQKSYLTYRLYDGRTGVETYCLDSIIMNGQIRNDYFRKKVPDINFGSCNIDTMIASNFAGNYHDVKLIDSIKTIGDTSFFYSAGSTLPFYFFTNAQVGQSWTIESDYWGNDYNQITITCDSIYQATFLGITDSIKLFSMIPDGTSANQDPVNNFTIKLSKNFGIIELVPFTLFLEHPANIDFFSMQIVGLQSDSIQSGYSSPLFSDYFKLTAGDILFWEYHRDPSDIQQPEVYEHYRDSITDTDIFLDSVVYTYDRVIEYADLSLSYQFGNHKYFRRNSLSPLVESEPEWFTCGSVEGLDSYIIYPRRLYLWNSFEMVINEDSITGDTITSLRLTTEENELDTISCTFVMTADIYNEIIFNNKAGIISYCEYAWGINCVTLIGSRINGIQSGNITLGTDEILVSSQLSIFPNPSKEKINLLANSNISNTEYSIFSLDGKNIKSGTYTGGEISIMELLPGIYFVKVISNGRNFVGQFVKE